jgi:hypothetical protein
MAQATRTLPPKRVLERLQRHRRAVIALAHQRAKRLVQASIRAKGQRLSDFSAREITILAEDYLAQHRQELIAEAENAIATSPYFVQWRVPVFEKNAETEHSLTTNRANSVVIAND